MFNVTEPARLQSAANAAAPYASEAIGRTFGHGENKNETAQAVGHFLLGAAIARVNGGNFAAGGSAAVAAEKAAEHLAQRYNDGKTAIDPQTGEFNANLLPEHIKEEIKSKSGVIASLTGAAVGGTPVDAQTGGEIGQNAVENNSVGISYSAWKKDQALIKEDPAAYSQLRIEQLQAINFLIDFIPVIGDIKGFAEAETKGDYFFATLGIIPLYGDAARKVHQAEKAYQAAKAAKNTEKMKAAIDQARSGVDLPYDSRQIRAELEKRYGAENITSTTVPRKPQQSVNNQNKSDYTSTVTSNLSGKSVRVDYKDPVSGKSLVANIAYDSRSLPIFDNVAKFTTRLDTSLSTTRQMRAATRSLRDAIEKGVIPKSNFTSTQLEDIMAGKRTINGYIWHHNAQSAPNNMQLVPLEIHDAVRHTGQNALKKGR
ncbi:HNH endonuclease [Neisseria lactamica]|uniref:HNH endonuclease n=1 Tax=Neisseria lactamica TaxID=486 RepID=UPI001EFFDBBE|nr:HNH endonuclease [Neisseria lactamica]